jgi:aspartate-semialdehyde dehydrogenase
MKKYKVAVVGATGVVGNEMIKMLEERNFPVESVKFLASARSVGKTLKFKGKDIPVELLTHDSGKGMDVALFSAGGQTSKDFLRHLQCRLVLIDNSSAW